MDNITHSLFGLATARIINKKVNKTDDPKISLFITFVSLFAANFPDFDLFFSLIDSGVIGYLSHHRGYTHTLIYLIPQAALLWGLSILCFKIKDNSIRLWGLAAIAINMVLHISLDYQNSYGVHPFHPFSNQWYYRDTLFIIEPLIWFSFLPMLLTPVPNLVENLKSKNLKSIARNLVWIGFVVLFLTLLLMAYNTYALEVVSLTICLALFSGLMVLFHKRTETSKAIISLVLSVVMISIFSITRHTTLNAVKANFAKNNKEQKLVDVVLSPMPANPQCWRFITVSTDEVQSYFLKTGAYESRALNFWKCPKGIYQNQSESYEEHRRKHDLMPVYVETTFSAALYTLVEDLGPADNCKRDEWLQFTRTPLKESTYVYDDIRFKRGADTSFTRLDITNPKVKCLNLKVPWIPPRQDLIDMAKKLQAG